MRQPHPRPLIAVLSPSPGLIRTPTSPLCHTLRHLADRSVRLLQPSLAGEVRTSVRSMARVRAARCSLGGGAWSLQSDVVVAAGLRGRTLRVRPADRLCFPPLPSQVRSRPTTSSARAAGDLAAPSRWSRAAPSPSATFRARVDDVLRACWRGRGGARDGGSRPPRTRRVAVRGARGRARAGRTRTAAVGSSASACGCPARARVSVACTCTVCRLRGREPRLTFSVGRELAVRGRSLRATVVCT